MTPACDQALNRLLASSVHPAPKAAGFRRQRRTWRRERDGLVDLVSV